MIAIDNTLISNEVVEEQFLCDLKACKGACCVLGDAGAPLEEHELSILDDEYENIKPFLRPEGIKVIEQNGKYAPDIEGDFGTPLVNEKECAYVIFDETGITKCGIEKAYEHGKTTFQKPISCYLYPVRITTYKKYDAVNYHEWDICKAAVLCGKKEKLPVFQFLKAPLIKKYGQDWFEALEAYYQSTQD